MASKIKILDTVQGLIDYTNDIKPYHTKVIEALIEYVAQETIDVSVFEYFEFTIENLYEFDGNYICLIGGYGTPYFGDPVDILVSSPDVSKTILEYPAIGTGFFIVLGDKTTLFDPTVNVNLSIASSIEDKLVDVNASTGSPPTGGAFTVLGDKTSDYPIGLSFSIVGSAFNDGDYVVASTTYPAGGFAVTQIDVNETVPTNNVEGFTSIPDSINTGVFSVISSEYNDNLTIPHTTVFMTGLSLVPPTFTTATHPNRRFISLINTQPLVYDRILGYSNALRLYETSSPSMPYYVADEGVVVSTIVGLTSTSFSILGDFQSSNLFIGDEFEVSDSSGNDGTYTITSSVYEFSGSPVSDFVTTFGVAAVSDGNIDGNVKLNIPSNVFIIDSSDYTGFFTQGSRVNITSGSLVGQYTTLNSQYFNNKTYIRVRETLIDEGTGRLIISTGTNYIAVDGDVTSIYGGSPAQQFNIVGSLKNDGAYTTTSTVYDVGTNTTQISIVEPFDITDISGEIHEFTSGDITHLPEGFGATVDLCELVPQALSISSITEDFKVLMGHKFTIEGIDSATNEIHIQDDNGYIYNIFTAGSPPDSHVEISDSGINNETYTITSVTGGSPSTTTVLTVTGILQNSGIFTGSPAIESGFLLYQKWWQYYVTNIAGSPPNQFIVAGDATVDVNPPSTIQHIFTNDIYTVNAISFDGNNTTITIDEPIVTTKLVGSPPVLVDVTAGSPPFDDWIISEAVIGNLTNLVSCDLNANRIYVHDGISGTTIDDFASPAFEISGLTFANGNLISCDLVTNLIYIHDGISGDILDSFPNTGGNPFGLTFANGNLISNSTITDRIYIHDGISEDILDSFPSPSSSPSGLTFANGNLISCDSNTNRIYVHDGISGTTLDDFASPSNVPYGLAFNGTNLISCDSNTNRIYVHDGISGTTIDDFASPNTYPAGLTMV